MSPKDTQRTLSREEVAKIEIGHTAVRPAVAWVLTGVFVATVFSVPVAQHVFEIREAFAADPALTWWPPTHYLPRSYGIFAAMPRAWRAIAGRGGSGALPGRDVSLFRRMKYANDRVLLREINEYTDALKDDSLLTDALLGPSQRLMANYLGVGNEQAYLGRDGWLFYRPGVDYVTGPGFLSGRYRRRRENDQNEWQDAATIDPIPAIVQFARQLDKRGIRLILMPTPVKPMIHPEKLSRRFEGHRQAVQNPSYAGFTLRGQAEFRGSLAAARRPVTPGRRIVLFDVTDELIARKFAADLPRQLYLATDTHWLPETMDYAAGRLAEVVRAELARQRGPGAAEPAACPYREQFEQVENVGDLAAMVQPLTKTEVARRIHRALYGALAAVGLRRNADLLLSDERRLFAPETVTVRRTLLPDGTPWRRDESSDVLLLGDSFSNVYSSGQMGWGSSAGLAERLSFHLGRSVDAIVRNDDGAYATRQELSEELRRGRDRLAGKKVVIWQFAMRELAVGDWRLLPMALGRPAAKATQPTDRLELAPREAVVVTGRIAAIKPTPRGKVPYKDHIMVLHLVDARGRDGQVRGVEAVVFLWGMRDNVRTRATRLKAGREITARIRRWDDVADKLGTIRRSELEDVDIDMGEFWCEQWK